MEIRDQKIYEYDAMILLENGTHDFENGKLMCDFLCTTLSNYKNNELKASPKTRDSLMLDQFEKEYGIDFDLEKSLIILDFKDYEKKHFELLKKFPNGITLELKRNELYNFKPFIKSSSMSRESRVYYINEEYEETMIKRCFFDFEKRKMKLSKWYAYSGLIASDAKLLDTDRIPINWNKVAIIDDAKVDRAHTNIITAVSVLSILDELKKLKENLKINKNNRFIRKTEIDDAIDKFNCYFNSKDYEKLTDSPKSVKELLEKIKHQIVDGFYDEISPKKIDEIHCVISKLSSEYESERNKSKIIWEKLYLEDFKLKEVNLFDGEGLISTELFIKINEILQEERGTPSDHRSFQIRLPFIKGVVHECNFRQFFKNKSKSKINTIWSISGKNSEGKYTYIEKSIDQVDLILTLSQFKCIKFLKKNEQIEDFFERLNRYEYPLALSQEDKGEDEEKGSDLNYQFLSTLHLNNLDEDIKKDIFKYNKEKLMDSTNIEKILKDNRGIYSKEYAVYNEDPDFFLATARSREIQNENFENEKGKLLIGKISIGGDNFLPNDRRYLSGDLLELLYHAYNFRRDEKNKIVMNSKEKLEGRYYIPFYGRYSKDIDKAVLLRNPHYSRNEIAIVSRFMNRKSERNKYFDQLNNVIMVDPLYLTNQRLGGADFDGDSVLIIQDKRLVKHIAENIKEEDYPVVVIPSINDDDNNLYAEYENVIECFRNTFNNFIGKISNHAFSDTMAYLQNEKPFDDDIAEYTILGGLEIDSQKNGKKPVLKKKFDQSTFIPLKENIQKKKVEDKDTKEKINKYLASDNKSFLSEVVREFKDVKNPIKGTKRPKYALKLKKEPTNISLYDICASIISYELLHKSIESRKVYQTDMFITKIGIIHENITRILEKNEYKFSTNDLINEVGKYKGHYLTLFNNYFDKNGKEKYHYIIDVKEREKFIVEKLEIDVPKIMLKALTDFRNEGYLLLFYVLFYLKNKESAYDRKTGELKLTSDYRKKEIDPSDYNVITNAGLKSQEIPIVIGMVEEDYIKDYSDKLDEIDNRSDAIEFLMKKYVTDKYSIETISKAINIFDNNSVFSLYYDSIIKYLKGKKVRRNVKNIN